MPGNLKKSSGQSTVEYILMAVLVALVLLAVVQLFGSEIRNLFFGYGQELTAGPPPVTPVSPGGTNPGGVPPPPPTEHPPSPPPPPPPPAPPPPPPRPPDPLPVGIDPYRHHLGDGSYSPGLGGGNLVNEGTSYRRTFALNMGQIQASEVQYATLRLYVDGVSMHQGQTIRNPISLNGIELGILQNGLNTFRVPVSHLSDTNTIQINSGSVWLTDRYGRSRIDYDDFEFWDLTMTWG